MRAALRPRDSSARAHGITVAARTRRKTGPARRLDLINYALRVCAMLACCVRFPLSSISSTDAGWSSLAARRAHNPKVVGSNPTPATSNAEMTKRRLTRLKAKKARAKRPDRHCDRAFALVEAIRALCAGHSRHRKHSLVFRAATQSPVDGASPRCYRDQRHVLLPNRAPACGSLATR